MTVASRYHHGGVAYPNDRTVFAYNSVFRLKTLTANTCCLRPLNDGMILHRNMSHPVAGVGEPLILGVARYCLDLRADVVPFPEQPKFRDIADGRHLLHERAIFVFGVGSCLLGFFACADIVADAR